MKKILAILLSLLMLVSCGQGTSGEVSDTVSEQGGEVAYTIGGVPLEDFAVTQSGAQYTSVKKIIFELMGVRAKTEGDKVIRFDTDESLNEISVRAAYDGGDLVIYTSGVGINEKDSTQIIYKLFESKINTQKTFDTTMKIMPEGFDVVTNEYVSQLRTETDNRIEEIKNTPNIQIPSGATVYYVSNSGSDSNDGKSAAKAWKTLEKVSEVALKEGDYVLFERGGFWRGQLKGQKGVTYSAYGEGEKPILVRSPENGADKSKWVRVGGNIWEYQTPFDKDVGTLVFNNGEAHAIKWLVFKNKDGILEEFKTKAKWDGVTTIKNDLEFWHSTDNKKIYLCSKENPGERFNSIEFNICNHAVLGAINATFDNLTIKYTGAHGISGGSKNLTVQNCTFEWIGGSIHHVNYSGAAPTPVRYGNGIEIFGGCNGFVIDNCYFNQIYDAAVTHQYDFGTITDVLPDADKGHYNVTFKNNVMEYSVYSIEYFLGNLPTGNKSYMGDILYENNLMWYAGQGLGSQRPDNTSPAHIKGWGHINPVKNFVIKNNLMVESTSMLIHSNFLNVNENGNNGVKLEGNVFIGEYGQNFGMFGFGTRGKTVEYTTEIEEYLKDFSSGNKFYFLDK